MNAAAAHRPRRSIPILEGVLPLDPARLPSDIIAGATLAALGIPEVMGYTKIAGTPVVTGLYTILLPIAVFALLGSSRHLVVGADSATAAVMAAGLAGMGVATTSPDYLPLASLSALLCGVILIGARLLKLGFIANFLSRSVLVGFLTGVGIQVAMGQLGGLFGVSEGSGTTLEKFGHALQAIPTETSVPTLVMSLTVLVVIVGLDRVDKRIPGALIAVVGAIAASYILDLSAKGVTTLGNVPGGLPAWGFPTDVMTQANVQALLPTAFSMFIVILAQSAATSRAYAMRYNDSFDENVDLIGLGFSNIAASFSGTFVVNGSPTKTEMVDSAGGRSQVAQLTTAAVVLVVLLFLTGPLSYMPNAVLSAVVFLIGIRLIDYKGMSAIARLRRGEFAVAALTAAVVVVVGVEQGIILAIVLSIVEHLSHSYRPYDTLVSLDANGRLVPSLPSSGSQIAPRMAAYRFGSSLYYANATRFTEEVVSIVESADPPLKRLLLLASAIGDIDYSAADSVRQVVEELADRGVTFAICDISPEVHAELDAYGLTERIGPANLYGSVSDAIAAYRAAEAAGSPASTTPTGSTTPAGRSEPPTIAGPSEPAE